MSDVIISFKNKSVTKLLKLQDEDMSSPYNKNFIQTTLSIASKQSTHNFHF